MRVTHTHTEKERLSVCKKERERERERETIREDGCSRVEYLRFQNGKKWRQKMRILDLVLSSVQNRLKGSTLWEKNGGGVVAQLSMVPCLEKKSIIYQGLHKTWSLTVVIRSNAIRQICSNDSYL